MTLAAVTLLSRHIVYSISSAMILICDIDDKQMLCFRLSLQVYLINVVISCSKYRLRAARNNPHADGRSYYASNVQRRTVDYAHIKKPPSKRVVFYSTDIAGHRFVPRDDIV